MIKRRMKGEKKDGQKETKNKRERRKRRRGGKVDLSRYSNVKCLEMEILLMAACLALPDT